MPVTKRTSSMLSLASLGVITAMCRRPPSVESGKS